MPHLSKILIYPIKSLDGIEVNTANVLPSGALENDREFAIADLNGKFVNGKRYPQIQKIRAEFDISARQVQLGVEGQTERQAFHLDRDRADLEAWLSAFFQFPVQLLHNPDTGYPDDLASPGPTLVSTATLEAISDWFPNLSVDEVRCRFRTNLEIAGVPAFWEDRLFGSADQVIPFQIGAVPFLGVNPCQRCVVPTRDSRTGIPDRSFQSEFIEQRQATLPGWADRTRFNHFYRLCLNTRVQTQGRSLKLSLNEVFSD